MARQPQVFRERLKARGDSAAERTFLNDTAGRTDRAQSEAPPWKKLCDRAALSHYAKGEIPSAALVICLGIGLSRRPARHRPRRDRRRLLDRGRMVGGEPASPGAKLIMLRSRAEEHAPRVARVKKERNENTSKLLKWAAASSTWAPA